MPFYFKLNSIVSMSAVLISLSDFFCIIVKSKVTLFCLS